MKKLITILLSLFLVACSSPTQQSNEDKAKLTVDKYLNTIKTSSSDVVNYASVVNKEITSAINWSYVSTESKNKHDRVILKNLETYNLLNKQKEFGTLENYINNERKMSQQLKTKIIKDSPQEIEYVLGTYDEYKFIYQVENGLKQKKHYIFTVTDKQNDNFFIEDIKLIIK